jgi:Tfp pilus assembly PilM family ATPase
MMNVTVVAHNQPLLVRDVSFSIEGNTHVGHGISEHFKKPQQEEVGHGGQAYEPVLNEEVWESEVVSELKRTVDGARECQADLDVEKIFLSSSLSISIEFLERLRQAISVPVSLIDPFLPLERKKSQKGSSPIPPFAGIAGGLALRGQVE